MCCAAKRLCVNGKSVPRNIFLYIFFIFLANRYNSFAKKISPKTKDYRKNRFAICLIERRMICAITIKHYFYDDLEISFR